MGALTKRRWLVLADRYPSMSEKEQAKLHERMLSWASLSAQQRNQARLNFENAKRLTPDDLLLKWQEYQALTAAEKEHLKAEGLKAEISTRASFNLDAGSASSGKYLYIYLRWYNTKHPALVGPWSSMHTTLIL